MAHILFADANESALRTMERAQHLGHRTSIVRNSSWQVYYDTAWTTRALSAAARDVCIPVTSDADAMTEAMAAIHRHDPVDGVVAQLEPAIEATAVACERLSIPFTCSAGVIAARNKDRARDLLEAAGLASARHAVAHDVEAALRIAESIGYPVVVKPASGMDSMLAFRVDDPIALQEAAVRVADAPSYLPAQITEQMSRGILVEEYLRGELVSTELALIDGDCHPIVVCGRSRGRDNDCLEMGASVPAGISVDDMERCFVYGEAACRAVGLDFGLFHVEMMLTPDGPSLVELNPRPMGGIMTEMYTQLTGRDFSDYILDVCLRKPPRDIVALTSEATITARKLIARQDSVLPAQLDLSWVDTEPGGVALHTYHLSPGDRVSAGEVLARCVVRGASWTTTMTRANQLIDRFEAALGIKLHHSGPVRV